GGDEVFAERAHEGQEPDHGEHGGDEAEHDGQKYPGMRGAVDLRRLVDLSGHGVEEAIHEERVDAQRAAQVDEDQPESSIEPDDGKDVAERQQEQGGEAGSAAGEPEP